MPKSDSHVAGRCLRGLQKWAEKNGDEIELAIGVQRASVEVPYFAFRKCNHSCNYCN